MHSLNLRRTLARLSLALVCGLTTPAFSAHPAGEPGPEVEAVRQSVVALGREWNPRVLAETARLYTSLHAHCTLDHGNARAHRHDG